MMPLLALVVACSTLLGAQHATAWPQLALMAPLLAIEQAVS